MTATRVRLLVTDVDGTLVGSDRSLAPSTVRAAEALRQAGIALALVSARAPAGLDVLIEPLRIDTPRAGFNGGVILSAANEMLLELTLDRTAAAASVATLEAWELDVWVFAKNRWFLKDADAAYIESERRSILMTPVVVPDFEPLLDGVHKIMGSSTDHQRVARCADALAGRLAGQAAVQCSQRYYVDVTHPHADKGRAVGVIADRLGIKRQAIASVGDMPNDVSMFGASALSFAMGNAPDAVKDRADHVVAGHDEGGWAEAVGMILDRRPG